LLRRLRTRVDEVDGLSLHELDTVVETLERVLQGQCVFLSRRLAKLRNLGAKLASISDVDAAGIDLGD